MRSNTDAESRPITDADDMRTKFLEEQFRQGRLDAKTLDNLFRRKIEHGANCSPFVSQAILKTVKEVYPLDPEDADRQLGLGQISLLVVAAEEPAGKPLEQCQKVTVRLTLEAGQEGIKSAWLMASRACAAPASSG